MANFRFIDHIRYDRLLQIRKPHIPTHRLPTLCCWPCVQMLMNCVHNFRSPTQETELCHQPEVTKKFGCTLCHIHFLLYLCSPSLLRGFLASWLQIYDSVYHLWVSEIHHLWVSEMSPPSDIYFLKAAQKCQGNGSHPASPDPGDRSWAPPALAATCNPQCCGTRCTRGCPWFLSQ